MKRNRWNRAFAIVLATAALSACAGTEDAAPGDDPTDTSRDRVDLLVSKIEKFPHKAVCATPERGELACHARVRVTPDGKIQNFATPSGFGPADLISAYKIPTSGGARKTIAIVDAFNNPKAESDLAVYRSQYGLPPCTTANGCFKKVNQDGNASPLPTTDNGWSGEISLDLDMASAACPNCKLLLVESNSASMDDLGTAVNR